jgi:antitoxin HigA-1
LKNHHLLPLSISLTELARILGFSRKTISKIVNERGAITPDMALRWPDSMNDIDIETFSMIGKQLEI